MKKDKKAILDALNKETKINTKFFGFILNKLFSRLQSDDYEYDGKVAYTADMKALICCMSDDKEIVIPEGVEEIGDMAFHGDAYLKKITFPSTLKKIGKDAFSECQNLEEITIPASVDTIRGYAFGDCDGLKDITFEGQPQLLARGIFEDCDGLRTIIVPDGTAKAFRKALRLGGDLDYIIVQKNSKFAPDEESNIMWSKRMQEEGVNVVFGVEGLKIHSKLLHIESTKGNIACVGTGNFHEGNAKIYTDYLMMTANPKIVNEVHKVFDFIDRPFAPVRFNELLVSPNSNKTRVLRLFDNEIRNARQGKEAWVKIKINHITDEDMVKKIYQASQAGVKIDILIRGNCSIVPGVPGLSENIRCVGIIDRYLEHSRILVFANGGEPRYYIGSSDWMPRNLINRIEVMTPVYDPDMQQDVLRTVEFGMRDNCNGRLVDGEGGDQIQTVPMGQKPFRSQEELNNAYIKENEGK